MIKPAFLLGAGFAFAALTALQFPPAELSQVTYEPTSRLSLQYSGTIPSAQATTLSATETAIPAQPQRWVF
ncbi:hypothetical protein [Stutzerimonas frequens]|uniref:hypothetical protein n=1 Tax=Stutzerimonas frequens TaxID=2968969 RepID=UPI0025559437|nr:hypothetical protein [Stutzerimonas frequens]MDL0441685.1 hypothetical protein [Stutzerimonas frequens]